MTELEQEIAVSNTEGSPDSTRFVVARYCHLKQVERRLQLGQSLGDRV
jgi:hypothetical protein